MSSKLRKFKIGHPGLEVAVTGIENNNGTWDAHVLIGGDEIYMQTHDTQDEAVAFAEGHLTRLLPVAAGAHPIFDREGEWR